MKKWLIVIFVFLGLSCQKDFPPAPDYSLQPGDVTLVEKWKYPVEENEEVLWVDVSDDDALYISRKEGKLIHHLFTLSGELLDRKEYTGLYSTSTYLTTSFKYRKGNFVLIKSSFTIILNIETGAYFEFLEDTEGVKDSTYDFFLEEEGQCYYLKKDKYKNVLIYELDLSTGQSLIYDTLAFQSEPLLYFECLGFFQNSATGNGYKNLVYLQKRYELFNGVTQYSLRSVYEYFFGLHGSWKSEDIFYTQGLPIKSSSSTFVDNHLYLSVGTVLPKIDMLSRKLVWMKSHRDYIDYNITVTDNEVIYTKNDVVEVVDRNSGASIWSKYYGIYAGGVSYENNLVAQVAFSRLSDDNFDYFPMVSIADFRNGRELLKEMDPIGHGDSDPNDLKKGLRRSMQLYKSDLYMADHKYFMCYAVEVAEKL